MATDVFVEQLYNQFLFRSSDEAGKNDWINRIESGDQSPAEVTYSFAVSQEYSERASAVSELYFLLFGRVPDSQGMQHWLDKIDEGMSLYDLATTFMASEEYHNIYGGAESDEAFLQLLTQNGFNRDISEGENGWLLLLSGDDGSGRATIVRAFAASDELDQLHGQKIQTTSLYYGLLNRAPTDDELAQAPDDPITLINALYGNEDYTGEPVPSYTPLPTIRVTDTTQTMNEGDGSVTVTVIREGNAEISTTVHYSSQERSDGASFGEDLNPFSGSITFEAGEISKQVQIPVIDDQEFESREDFRFQIDSVEGGTLHEYLRSTSITIVDNEGLQPTPISEFATQSRAVFENITVNNESYGHLVPSAAGDVNGDGLSDFLISTDTAHYLVFGSAQLPDSLPDLNRLDGTNGIRITNSGNDGYTTVKSAGDVNGDGFSDLIFGNGRVDNYTGQAYLVFGHSGKWSPSLSLSEDLDGSNGVLINGITPGDGTAASVSGAGDVNGDGFDDLLISSPSALKQTSWAAGQVHLIYGRAGDWEPRFELSQFDSTDGVAFVGDLDNPFALGDSAIGVGDINGDGIDDIAMMEGGYESGRTSITGYTDIYFVYGKTEGWDSPYFLQNRVEGDTTEFKFYSTVREHYTEFSGDFNGDGISDLLIGQDRRDYGGADAIVLFGSAEGWPETTQLRDIATFIEEDIEYWGFSREFSVANLGDINGDGIEDLKVDEYILFGHAGDWQDSLILRSLDEQQARRLSFEGDPDSAGLGDVNGDGYVDFMITDRTATNTSDEEILDSGKAYLIFGSDQLFG